MLKGTGEKIYEVKGQNRWAGKQQLQSPLGEF